MYQNLLATLLPPVSYQSNNNVIGAELNAEANALHVTEIHANRALNAVTPIYAESLLADWERVLGLPIFPSNLTYQARKERVIAKINETGGLSRAYFIRLAASMGYTITITEPTAFHVGINRCGDRLADKDIIFTWYVNVQGDASIYYRFRTGMSTVGERLTSFSEPILEELINDLKPAHTKVFFTYSSEVKNG